MSGSGGGAGRGGGGGEAPEPDPYDPDTVRTRHYGPRCDVTAPVDAVIVHPGDDLQTAIDAAGPGGRLFLEAGSHRIAERLRFVDEQEIWGHCEAAITGSRIVDGFLQEGNNWVVAGAGSVEHSEPKCFVDDCSWSICDGGPGKSACQADGPGTCGTATCWRNQDLFLDGMRLRHTATRGEVEPGAWHYDYAQNEIVLGDDPQGHLVELSVLRELTEGYADDLTLYNLTFRQFASASQRAALRQFGNGLAIRDCEISDNHGAAVMIPTDGLIEGSRVVRNGQIGIGANQSLSAIVRFNEIAHNNPDGLYSSGFHAGGTKFVRTEDLLVEANWVHDNGGTGLWTDIFNHRPTYLYNVCERNTDHGLSHEISYAARIEHNTMVDNHEAGIQIRSAGSLDGQVVVEGNHLQGNGKGIWVHQDARRLENGSRNVVVRDNEVDQPGFDKATRCAEPGFDAGCCTGGYGCGHEGWGIALGLRGAGVQRCIDTGLCDGDAYYDGTYGNVFSGNDIALSEAGSSAFYWDYGTVDWGTWQQAGNDADGSVSP